MNKRYTQFYYHAGDEHFRYTDYGKQNFILINYHKDKNNWFSLYLKSDGEIKDDINLNLDGKNYRKEAKKLNRNPLLWFLLGFLEFHAAFIALALGKTIYKVHKDDKILFSDLESEYDEKVNSFKELNNALKKLDKESLIYKKEYKEPLAKIKHQYSIKFDEMIKKLTTSRVKEKSVEKLNRALNAGVINKDEFDMKISKL